MNPELVNVYIDRLLNEVTEGVKSRILLETQLKFQQTVIEQLQNKIKEQEQQLEKINKKSKKEVNTSDNF